MANFTIEDVYLHREGLDTQWGFRLHGGTEFDQPLIVQRVFIGSPSEGGLHRGDELISIQGITGRNLSHHDVEAIIRKAGSHLNLRVKRVGAAGQYGAPVQPTSPYGGSTNYQHSPQQSYHQPQVPSYQQQYSYSPQPTYQPSYQQQHYSPSRPTSSVPASHYATTRRPHSGAVAPKKELWDVRAEKNREQDAIQSQPFRTRQLINPTVKPTWDYPTGSYLAAQRRAGHAEVVNREPEGQDHLMSIQQPVSPWGQQNLRPAQAPTYHQQPATPPVKFAPPPGGKPFVIPTEDKNKRIVHAQYNSPLGMYSAENVADTMEGQTGYRPVPTANDVGGQGNFVPSATARAVLEEDTRRFGGVAYTGGALQVQEQEPYQSKSVSELQNMFNN